jgi:tRNA/rRNA methyltransferase
MGENIGAAARAMANFGLNHLRIVAPRDGWPNEVAISNAAGAFDLFDAEIFDTLADALADVNYAYATTARMRDIAKPIFTPHKATMDAAERCANGEAHCAFVFGPERTGLENHEIAQCHSIVNVPTDPAFSSLNLGQCVLLIAYEIAQVFALTQTYAREHSPATIQSFDHLFERLTQALDEGQFFQEDNLRPTMVRNIRAALMRAEMSEQEIRTFHGVLTALRRA